MVVRKSQKTNEPFQVSCVNFLFEVPRGASVLPCMSIDGENFYTIYSAITGPELVEVGPVVPGAMMYMKTVEALGQKEIKILY